MMFGYRLREALAMQCSFVMARLGIISSRLQVLLRVRGIWRFDFVATRRYMVQPSAVVWVANDLRVHYDEFSIGLAMMIGFANMGGIIAGNVFEQTQAPR